jgi:hypothetical protein
MTPKAVTPRRPPPSTSTPLGIPLAGGPAKVKASFVAGAASALRERFGQRAFEHLCGALPEAIRDVASGIILPLAWIDLAAFVALLDAADRTFGNGSGDVPRDLGVAIAAREIPTTQRLFLQSATPTLAAQRIPQIFRAYHDRGDIRVETTGNQAWRVDLEGIQPDTFAYANMLSGFCERLLELSGAHDARCTVLSSGGRGDAKTSLQLRWR